MTRENADGYIKMVIFLRFFYIHGSGNGRVPFPSIEEGTGANKLKLLK